MDVVAKYVLVVDELAVLIVARRELGAMVRQLEDGVSSWIAERPSRAWLATSQLSGQRRFAVQVTHVHAKVTTVTTATTLTSRPSMVIRQSTVRRSLLEVASLVCAELTQRGGTDNVDVVQLGADLADAVFRWHVRERKADAKVSDTHPSIKIIPGPGSRRTAHDNDGPKGGPWVRPEPVDRSERTIFKKEATTSHVHQRAPQLAWPLLVVLIERTRRLRERKRQLLVERARLAGAVATALLDDGAAGPGPVHTLPDGRRLSVVTTQRRDTSRRRTFTPASLASATTEFLSGAECKVPHDAALMAGRALGQALAEAELRARKGKKRALGQQGNVVAPKKRGRWLKQ